MRVRIPRIEEKETFCIYGKSFESCNQECKGKCKKRGEHLRKKCIRDDYWDDCPHLACSNYKKCNSTRQFSLYCNPPLTEEEKKLLLKYIDWLDKE